MEGERKVAEVPPPAHDCMSKHAVISGCSKNCANSRSAAPSPKKVPAKIRETTSGKFARSLDGSRAPPRVLHEV